MIKDLDPRRKKPPKKTSRTPRKALRNPPKYTDFAKAMHRKWQAGGDATLAGLGLRSYTEAVKMGFKGHHEEWNQLIYANGDTEKAGLDAE